MRESRASLHDGPCCRSGHVHLTLADQTLLGADGAQPESKRSREQARGGDALGAHGNGLAAPRRPTTLTSTAGGWPASRRIVAEEISRQSCTVLVAPALVRARSRDERMPTTSRAPAATRTHTRAGVLEDDALRRQAKQPAPFRYGSAYGFGARALGTSRSSCR